PAKPAKPDAAGAPPAGATGGEE
ncbi:MAG TPA: aminoacyl-tRNA hydrolase, partial [Tistrella mobilis]|nr:aminoacyl-tRNA hydrolase [Tistrella mobilis]